MNELKKILILDDDDSIRRIAELTLTRIGKFEVKLCKHHTEFFELLTGYLPDLILLDVMMPGMDGPTVLSNLRKDPRTASIPVVFMTAKIQRHEVEAYSQLGASGLIRKPFEPAELPVELRRLYAGAMKVCA
ncbi:MAG TPA: response regulator [Planktothrix sp.]|jgi:CheY-like chemotaxis protein